ncbi:MAG: hypothetical protein WA705_05415 [Candidatus Ozemobacteraceae bacterium]
MKRQDLSNFSSICFRASPALLIIVLIGITQVTCTPAVFGGDTSMITYAPPNNLALTLEPKNAEATVPPMTLIGMLESRTGTPSQLVVFFESSADLAVTPASANVAVLSQQKPVTFRIEVKRGVGKPDAGGTWVRMRVTYLPDYLAQAHLIRNVKKYSNSYERRRLFEVIRKNQKAREHQTDAIRYFPK